MDDNSIIVASTEDGFVANLENNTAAKNAQTSQASNSSTGASQNAQALLNGLNKNTPSGTVS